MGYRTAWVGGFLVAGLIGLLALPSWAQETLTVTTLIDTADPPFDADDPCGVGTLEDLPGADGEVSLREAIIAANNTEGAQTIVFDPGLIGKTPLFVGFDTQNAGLALNPLPWLCGGFVTIVGDVDGDGLSDITLDGSALEKESPTSIPSPLNVFCTTLVLGCSPDPVEEPPIRGNGFTIISSENTIFGLTLVNFPGSGVMLGAPNLLIPGVEVILPDAFLTSNTLLGNVISRSGSFGVIIWARSTPSYVSISNTTITENNIEENRAGGIIVQTTGRSAVAGLTIANTAIVSNVVTGNRGFGVAVFPNNTQGTVITQMAITNNAISANTLTGVAIFGGADAATGNIVDAVIEGNTITDNDVGPGFIAGISVVGGITSVGGEGATNNTVAVEIRDNLVQDNIGTSITVVAGQGDASDNTVAGVIEANTVVNNMQHHH